MIVSFRDKATQRLWLDGRSRAFAQDVVKAALRKLYILHAANTIDDLRNPPGNRLELLKADRLGQHSIRINGQFRICFVWKEEGAHDVEIVDYH
jgi:proteic killer suppression protein